MSSGANRKSEPTPPGTLPEALLQGLGKQRLSPSGDGGRTREPWSEETREQYRSSLLPGITPVTLHDVRTFYRLLGEQLERAKREQLPLSVVAFHGPGFWEGSRRRAVELVLRLGVRREELTTRLTETTLAIAVPGPATAALELVERLVPLLSEQAQGKVVAGVAQYPADGESANALLRAAAWRSVVSADPRQQEPALERLLGAPPRPSSGTETWGPPRTRRTAS